MVHDASHAATPTRRAAAPRPVKRHRAVAAALLLAASAASVPHAGAAAQPTPDHDTRPRSGAAAAEPGAPRGEAETRRWAALFAEAAALINLRLTQQPGAADYELASRTLAAASELAPDDAQLARRWAQAAWSASIADHVRRASRRVVQADPNDTVAQLRVISEAVSGAQTVEGRLSRLEAFLGPRGSSLPPEVRSRLALEAAMLRRELGDPDGFADRLTSAIRLDPAHKEAIALALGYYTAQVGEPTGELELLVRLFYADPFDAKTAVRVAELLAAEAAMVQARRFHDLAWDLVITLREPDAELYAQRYALVWDDEGPGAVALDIARRLRDFRSIAEARYEAGVRRDVPQDELIEPEDVHLPSITEVTRTIAAVEAGLDEQIQQGLDELESISDQRIEDRLNNPGRPGLTAAAIRAYSDLMIMRLFAGREIEEVQRSMAGLRADGQGDLITDVALAWLAFRLEGPEAALDRLERIEGANPYVRMLEVVAGAASAQTELAERAARRLASSQPLGVFGAWGRYRLRAIRGQDVVTTALGRELASTAAKVPDRLLRLHEDPLLFVGLTLDPIETPSREFPSRVRLALRNTSRLPLGVGADRPLGTRVMLSGELASSERVLGPRRPEVIELNHRLTLAPGEAMTTTVRPSVGANLIADLANADRTISRRWSAVQSFTLGSRQTIEPGPFARADRTDPRIIRPIPEAAQGPAELAAALRSSARGERGWLLLGVASMLWRAGSGAEGTPPPEAPGVSELIRALTEALDGMTHDERLLALAATPAAAQLPAMQPFDDAAADRAAAALAADPDAQTRESTEIARLEALFALLTRVADPEHPLLAAASEHGGNGLARAATLLGDRLRSGVPSRATAGPGLAPLASGTVLSPGRTPGVAPEGGRGGPRADER